MSKKYPVVVLFLLIILFVFTGCQQDEEIANVDEEPTEEIATTQESTETVEEVSDDLETASHRPSLHPILKDITVEAVGGEYDDIYMRSEYVPVMLNLEEAVQYPELASALEEHREMMANATREHFTYDYDIAREFYENAPSYDILYYLGQGETDIIRADEQVYSCLNRTYHLSRGDWFYYLYQGLNFDTKTGQPLYIDDVVTDIDAFLGLFDEKVTALGLEELIPTDFHEELLKEVRHHPEMLSFTISHKGIDVYYSDFSDEPENMTSLTFHFSVDDYPELLNEELFPETNSYVEPLIPYIKTVVDIEGDGTAEELHVQYGIDENDYYQVFSLFLDGEEVFHDEDALDNQAFLVNLNETYYLYLFQESENGYGTLKVIGFEGSTPSVLQVYDNVSIAPLYMDFHFDNAEETISSFEIAYMTFTDLHDLVLASKLDGLGTVFGVKRYGVGDDGLLVTDDVDYRISGNWQDEFVENTNVRSWTFTLKQDLEMTVLEENAVSHDVITLSIGTPITYIRTDDSTYADFRLEDGTEVRAEVDVDNHTINGIDIFEALDGVMFAG